MHYLAILFASIVLLSNEVSLTNIQAVLYDYKPSDGSESKDLHLNESLTIQGKVRFPDDPDGSINYLIIELKVLGQDKYNEFDVLNFISCHSTKDFYCIQRQEKNEYDIYLNTVVVSNFNRSEWRLRGLYNGKHFESNSMKLPMISFSTLSASSKIIVIIVSVVVAVVLLALGLFIFRVLCCKKRQARHNVVGNQQPRNGANMVEDRSNQVLTTKQKGKVQLESYRQKKKKKNTKQN